MVFVHEWRHFVSANFVLFMLTSLVWYATTTFWIKLGEKGLLYWGYAIGGYVKMAGRRCLWMMKREKILMECSSRTMV